MDDDSSKSLITKWLNSKIRYIYSYAISWSFNNLSRFFVVIQPLRG